MTKKQNRKKKLKVTVPKSRPMLYWVGKQPPEFVQGYPCQSMESYDPQEKNKILKTPRYDDLKNNWYNLLFHGDNKDILATLLEHGFRSKVDLIYIDPPFASNKDYLRKVELRGLKDLGRIEEDDASILQQTMYEDIWKRDEYFQFMYDRLILLKELLAETGSIYVHLDYRMVHYIKLLMDEIFGEENFRNEISWKRGRAVVHSSTNQFVRLHDTILFYTKNNERSVFNKVFQPYKKSTLKMYRHEDKQGKYRLQELRDYSEQNIKKFKQEGRIEKKNGKLYLKQYLKDKKGVPLDDVWTKIGSVSYKHRGELTGFSTQKPIALLKRIIKASSGSNDLILDSFVGSGTSCVAAQKLGRRWIGVDVNKGAIQLTSKRLQKIIQGQIKEDEPVSEYFLFASYKVNNYDLKILKTEAKELAIQQYGITKTKTDTFFDGIRDENELVKIIDFNHPLTLLDLQKIEDELGKRPDEDRDVIVTCLSRETKVDAWVEERNKKQPYRDTRTKQRMNQFIIFDLKDKNFIAYEPPKADVEIKRIDKNKVKIKIKNFISPTIIKRLEIERNLLSKKIPDFRSMIDVVLIDTNYDGKVFNINFSDVPEKKDDLVKGEYEIEIPKDETKIAVKIIDMLGDNILETKEI